MNITRVLTNLAGAEREILPPYEVNFPADTRNSAWRIYASNISEWVSGDDPIVRAQFEILGVRTLDVNVGVITPGTGTAYWRIDPNVYPYSEPGVLRLNSLWSASGKLRWMNPNS